MKKIRYTVLPLLLIIPLLACQRVEPSSIHSSEIVSSAVFSSSSKADSSLNSNSVNSSNVVSSSDAFSEIVTTSSESISSESLTSSSEIVSSEPIVSSKEAPTVTNLKVEPKGHFTEAQLNYLSNDDPSNTSPYNGNMSVSKPEPVVISWDSNVAGPFKVNIIAEENSIDLTYLSESSSFNFYNPLFGVDYTVNIYVEDELLASTSFKETPTVSGPRNLYIDGVENVRDIGGWGYLEDGAYKTYIKQGMLYRSGRFNADKADPVNVTISNDGINEMINNLKIKTEIDLRRTSNNEVGSLTDKSVLGDCVTYYQLPLAYGGNNILTFTGKLSGDDYTYNNPAFIKSFFELLKDSNNYPINFHCSIGKDRTGCLSYLIEGLLGFDQETMYRDYMFTNFADAGMSKITDLTANNRYGKTINDYENGDSLQEKIYNYLHEVVEVPTEDLDAIIDILKA